MWSDLNLLAVVIVLFLTHHLLYYTHATIIILHMLHVVVNPLSVIRQLKSEF